MNDNISGHDSRATPGGHLIVASRYAEGFAEDMFEPRYWENANAVTGTAGGRGMVLFVDSGHEQWVLRHYRRGGLMTPVMDDRYFWSGLQNTRAVREFRLLHDLHERGLPVPRPVAARVCRDGLFYRADLLTVRIADARSLADIASESMPDDATWRAIGRCIRRFHDIGVFHADLNAHNILLDQQGQVYLVDFDRGRIRYGTRWKQANLRRLNRSLHKIGLSLGSPEFEKQQWPALLDGYEPGGAAAKS